MKFLKTTVCCLFALCLFAGCTSDKVENVSADAADVLSGEDTTSDTDTSSDTSATGDAVKETFVADQ